MREKYRVRQFRFTRGRSVVEQRLVVAVIGFPPGDSFRRHALHAQMDACHVVRAVDEKEQHEGDQIDADQDRDRVQQTADDISNHLRVPRSRLRYATTAGTVTDTSRTAMTAIGQKTDWFQAARNSARLIGLMRRYLSVLFARLFGLALYTQECSSRKSFGCTPQAQGASRRAMSTILSMIAWRSGVSSMFFICSNRRLNSGLS